MKSSILTFAALGLSLAACGKQSLITVEAIPAVETDTEVSTELNDANFDSAQITNLIPSKIIGENNLVKVKADGSNIEAGLRKYLDALGIIQMGQNGLCSGTHIGNGYVLTAGHCFLNPENSAPQTASGKSCSDTKIYFGYRGSVATGSAKPAVSLIATCTQIVYAELNKDSDFAILKINKAPKVSIAISTDAKRTAAGTKLTIFGYPQGRPLEWSQYCSLKLNTSITQMSDKKGESSFTHGCDTEAGNSGSAILGITSTGTVKVIGIHDGLIPGDDLNYGTYLFDARTKLKAKGFDLDQAVKAPNSLSF